MRKDTLFTALAVALTAAILSGCHNTTDGITSGLEYSSDIQFVDYSDTTVMNMPKMAEIVNKPAYGTMITIGVFPVKIGDIDIKPLQNAILSTAYGKQDCTIAEAIRYNNSHSALAEEGDSLLRASLPLQRDSAASEQYSIISVQTMTNTMMSFAVYQYIYPYGAAHGMNSTTYVNYYITGRQLLTADNLFEATSQADIISVLRQAAKDQYASVDTMVDPDEINNYDNFYVSPGNITFVYAPYEIAPYAAGQVQVSVASYQLYDYLTPLGKSVFGF